MIPLPGKAKRKVGQMHLSSRWETSREPTLQKAKSGKALESSRLGLLML